MKLISNHILNFKQTVRECQACFFAGNIQPCFEGGRNLTTTGETKFTRKTSIVTNFLASGLVRQALAVTFLLLLRVFIPKSNFSVFLKGYIRFV